MKNSSTVVVPDFPPDLVLETLERSVSEVTNVNFDTLVASIKDGLDKLLASSLAAPAYPIPPDPCASPKPSIAPACRTLALALQTSKTTLDQALITAQSTMETALSSWSGAVSQYNFAIANAQDTYSVSAATAIANYEQATNPDSSSRNAMLYYTMQQAVATAMVTYETAAAGAAGPLAAAAGTLLTAYTTYLGAVNGALATQLQSDSAARQAFWLSVEGTLDANPS